MEARTPTNHRRQLLRQIRFSIANIQIHRADISAKSGDFDTAIKEYTTVLQSIEPEYELLAARVAHKRGVAHLYLAQYSTAVGDFRNAVERFGEGTDRGEVADSKKYLGIALKKGERGDEAIPYLLQAAEYHDRMLRWSGSPEDVESLKEIRELLVVIQGETDRIERNQYRGD